MFVNRRFARFLPLLTLSILLFLGAIAATAALPEVERVEGAATLKEPGRAEPVVLKAKARIPEGSKIQTKLGSRVVIRLDNGSTINLRENSVFEMTKSSSGKYDFKLWIGELRTQVQKLKPSEAYTVRTGVAVAGVRGTDFLIAADDDGGTGLSVYEGLVEFRSLVTGAQVMVGSSQSAEVDPSGALSKVMNIVRTGDDEEKPGPAGSLSGSASSTAIVPFAISAPVNGSVTASRSVTVLGTARPGATVIVNGIPAVADPAGRFTAQVNLAEGNNAVTAELEGERREVTIVVDSLRPVITIGPYAEVTNLSSVRLTVNTKDGATVTAGGVATVAAGGVATLVVNLSEGENLVTISSADQRGLSSQKTIRITVDSIKPTLTIVSMTTTPTGVRVSGITEPGVTVKANGYPLEVRSDGSFDQVLAGLSASEVTFEARDAAGNVTRDVRNVTGSVDNGPPTLLSFGFSPGSVEVGSNANVTMQVSDASDVAPTVALSLTGSNGGSLATTLSASGQTYTGLIPVPSNATAGVYTPGAITLSDILGNAVTVTPATTLVVTNTAPPAPGSINAVDATTGQQATVTWGAVSATDLADYTLNQGPSASGPWSPVYIGTATSRVLTGLVNGTTYFFHVTARDNGGNVSSPSTVVSVMPSDQVAPATPGGLTGNGISSSQIALSWSGSAGASSYKVYRSLNAGGGAPWQFLAQTSSTSYTAGGLASGTTYFFSVTALDNNTAPPSGSPNESTVGSNSASATTL